MGTYAPKLAALQQSESMPHYRTVRRAIEDSQPPIDLVQVKKNLKTNVITSYYGLNTKEDTEDEETQFVEAKMKVSDVIRFHKSVHTGEVQVTNVHLGIDGVAEAKSNKVSLNVFALMFPGCRNVYCICIQRPKHSADKGAARRYTKELVDELK